MLDWVKSPGNWKTGFLLAGLLTLVHCGTESIAPQAEELYSGSSVCRDCHARFYDLWSTSYHGLAMQPLTGTFAAQNITPLDPPIQVGNYAYRVRQGSGGAFEVLETGPEGEVRYPMVHVLGGKYIYYFLTTRERGWLQVLPVAFDVREREWFDTTASMVRHFEDRPDAALHWLERPLTFNTSCYSCHVSQLSKNYDAETDSYQSIWAEPGINCETCHGPAGEHVRVCQEAGEAIPEDLKIVSWSDFTVEQTNDMCAPCHAKMNPITRGFPPGEKYFDHFNLHTLENPDFFPDGRDLGENYTFTQWKMSPCVVSGQLDCVHCHTSSGRYRFAGERTDQACAPCHQELVDDPEEHSRHSGGEEHVSCVSCHMPATVFARMTRHDHTMLPPTPATSREFGSPDACVLCHTDKDVAWADRWVREWYEGDYQAPYLHRARLVDAARRGDWSRLAEILEYVEAPQANEVFVASLLRLLEGCPDSQKWPSIVRSASHTSPLVRSAAVGVLRPDLGQEAVRALARAAGDSIRLVRTQAAASLAGYPLEVLDSAQRTAVERAYAEYEDSLRSRLDDWSYRYSLGNFYSRLGRQKEALESFSNASRLNPASILPMVNASMVHARLGETAQAQELLEKALALEPESLEAHFNLGLLLAEKGRADEAESHLRKVLQVDANFHGAAYNLCVLLAEKRPAEALGFCRHAWRALPESPKYSYSLAFYLLRSNQAGEAVRVLEETLVQGSGDASHYRLLAAIYEQQGNLEAVREVARRAARDTRLPEGDRHLFQLRSEPQTRP